MGKTQKNIYPSEITISIYLGSFIIGYIKIRIFFLLLTYMFYFLSVITGEGYFGESSIFFQNAFDSNVRQDKSSRQITNGGFIVKNASSFYALYSLKAIQTLIIYVYINKENKGKI